MSTTSKYLKVKEYFKLSEDGLSSREQTNPRYKNFKQVNYISTSKVSCSGVGSDSHPIVYLDLSSGNVVSCPYCGTKFLKK